MKTRLKVSLVGGAVAVVAMALLVLKVVLDWPTTARLANGTELSLLAVTCGPTNIFFPGGIRDRFIYSLVGSKAMGLGRFKVGPVSPIIDEWRKQNGSLAHASDTRSELDWVAI